MANFRDGDWSTLRQTIDELQRRVTEMGRRGETVNLTPQYFTLPDVTSIKSPSAGNVAWNTETNKVCRYDGTEWVDAS